MKKSLVKFLTSVLCLAVFIQSVASCNTDKRKFLLPQAEVVIEKTDGSSVKLVAEVAVRSEERNYGFMNRTEIPEGTGMLFVFENDDFRSFWMKDCPHPLSIAYILRDGTITDLLDMKPFSTASVNSSRSVRYALEVPQGWYEKAGIKTDDKVIIPEIKPEWQKESKLNKKAK